MYQPLLANRYLASRIIPLIAVAAVALCVGLVIIVVSVMSGFLDMLLNSGRTLMGDVIVRYADPGIPHYDLLVEEIESRPEAAAATPVVGDHQRRRLRGDERLLAHARGATEPLGFPPGALS